MSKKPLGHKSYGSIPHLPGSRRGSSDKGISEKQAEIAVGPKRKSKRHHVIVQEKLDGGCVGCAKINGEIIPLGRAGYLAISSPYEQHRLFHDWAMKNYKRFDKVLNEGERLVGEWLAQAHGTRYDLYLRDPFVAFDIMHDGHKRLCYDVFYERIYKHFYSAWAFHKGDPYPAWLAMERINNRMSGAKRGFYGALESVEGAVWRVEYDKPTGVKGESNREVLFLAKYVRPDKVDGKYLPEVSGKDPVWNWRP